MTKQERDENSELVMNIGAACSAVVGVGQTDAGVMKT
jgi:hypothetical protein